MLGTVNHSPSRQTKSKAHRHQGAGRACFEALEGRRLMSFAPAASFAAGPNPQAVAAADFNRDGRLDLVTSNPGDNTVSVLLGDGRGGFGPAARFAACAMPGADRASLAVADFNGDGNPDVATAQHYLDADYYNWGNLSLLLGNGDGSFRPATSVGGGLSVAAGDFNADGRADLLAGYDDYNSFGGVQVLLGNGAGGFTYAAPYQMNTPPAAFAAGDVNGDAKLDAVVLLANGWSALGRGDGTFVEPDPWYTYEFYTTSVARRVALGDFTGDGKPDAVFAGDTIAVHRGHGDGFFDGPVDHAANGRLHADVATADFDGDGRLDAVTADADAGSASLMLGNGDGTLRYAGAFATGAAPSAVAVGDFNGDARPDVASADAGSGTVSVLLNSGTWPVVTPPSVRISDVTVTEGNAGASNAVFTVTLSAPSSHPVTVRYATADGTARAGSDYQATAGALTLAPGETSKTLNVVVTGDRLPEPDEAFAVRLSDATNASIADGLAAGTIRDDEPRLSINSASVTEGHSGTKAMTFTVTLSAAYDQAVTVNFATRDGTAKAGEDYTARSGSLSFAPGETAKTITISVKGDKKREVSESFFVDLFGPGSNALVGVSRGTGTILDDD